jgi:hypothetical protein
LSWAQNDPEHGRRLDERRPRFLLDTGADADAEVVAVAVACGEKERPDLVVAEIRSFTCPPLNRYR